MNNSISIIGGADGPTSIFLGGRIGISWLNMLGLILVVILSQLRSVLTLWVFQTILLRCW